MDPWVDLHLLKTHLGLKLFKLTVLLLTVLLNLVLGLLLGLLQATGLPWEDAKKGEELKEY